MMVEDPHGKVFCSSESNLFVQLSKINTGNPSKQFLIIT
jgi:hypothetical protein